MKRFLIFLMMLSLIFSVSFAEDAFEETDPVLSVTSLPWIVSRNGISYDGFYTGDIVDGKPDGYGIFECIQPAWGDPWHYIGTWLDGIMDGEGALYSDGLSVEFGTFMLNELIDGTRYTQIGFEFEEIHLELPPDRSLDPSYVGNSNSRKFHSPNCSSVTKMKESNKVEFYSREEAVAAGYAPCGSCKP